MSFAVLALLIINLNTASTRELQSLPGIGPTLAKRIIEFREKRHGFRRVEELLAIPGISEKKWKLIREKVEVSSRSSGTTLAPSVSPQAAERRHNFSHGR